MHPPWMGGFTSDSVQIDYVPLLPEDIQKYYDPMDQQKGAATESQQSSSQCNTSQSMDSNISSGAQSVEHSHHAG